MAGQCFVAKMFATWHALDVMADLLAKHKEFARQFIVDFNATQAAIRSGYSESTAKATAYKILARNDVQAELKRIQAEVEDRDELTREWVEKRLMKVAGRCLQEVEILTDKVGRPLTETDDDGVDRMICRFDAAGANRSLELLGKTKRMFVDRIEHAGHFTHEQLITGEGLDDDEA